MDNTPLFKLVNFAPGSYIILEGEKKSSSFYIIKEGKILIKREFPVPGEKSSETLTQGDFFGVISAMSQYPQIESAMALTNVTLIAVSNNRFGELIQKNTPLAMKIIRSYSKKLRELDHGQSQGKMIEVKSPPDSLSLLFTMAENYFNLGITESSVYLYQSYLKYLPDGEFAKKSKDRLKMLGQPIEHPVIDGSNRSYQSNQMIFCENEPGNDLFIIQRGRVRISKLLNGNDVTLNIMKQGDIFGEMAILDNKPRSASATAMEDTDMLSIGRANFETMVVTQPQLMTRIIVLLSERIWISYKKISNSQISDMNGRIADLMLTLIEKSKTKIQKKQGFNFQLGPVDFMKMLGLSDRDLNVLNKFMSSNKFIRLENDDLYCSDIDLLERLVHYYKEGRVKSPNHN